MSMMTVLFVRWLMAGLLLATVWQNAHWSVGLCLTLIYLESEMAAWYERRRQRGILAVRRGRVLIVPRGTKD